MTSVAGLPKVSIITTSYSIERLGDITELLDSIHAQAYKNIEVLVVTERSQELTDSIKTYIKEKGYSNIKVLYNEGEWGSYPSRNLGIAQASGDILAFVDDDALPFPNWAEETAKTYAEDSSIVGLTGPILPLWKQDSMAWFPKEFYWIFSCTYWDWAEKTEVRNGYCTNLSFRREAFDTCGLFKTSLVGKGHGKSDWQQPAAQETEFCLRAKQGTGKRIIYDPNTRVWHKVYSYRLSTRFLAKRSYWEGYDKAMLNRWYHVSGETVLSTEYELLHRIFFKLIPNSLKLLFRQPIIALRQLGVTVTVLSCVAAGYLAHQVSTLSARG